MDEWDQLEHIGMLEELVFMVNCFLEDKGLNDEFKEYLKAVESEES